MSPSASPFSYLFKETEQFENREGLSLRYISLRTSAGKPRGTVILLNGWTEFIEKYGEPASRILEKGFDVFMMDWRGQGLSTRVLPNRQKGYIKDFSDFVGDLHEFTEHIVKPNAIAPYILMAHSMGGNISLQYLHDHPDMIQKAILCCPMLDLAVPLAVKVGFGILANGARLLGKDTAYVLGRGDWNETPFEENQVTSDSVRFAHDQELLQQNPDFRVGGQTYAWVSAALKAIKRVNDKTFLKNVKIPIMMFSATDDQLIPASALMNISRQLPQCELVSIQGQHELLREKDEIQAKLWEHFDRFLAEVKRG